MTPRLKIIFLFFCISFAGLAQDHNIDSLKTELEKAKHDTTRCNILNVLAEFSEENLLYTEQLLKLSEKNAATASSKTLRTFYLRHYGDALGNMALIANGEDNIFKAIQYFQKSLKIYRIIDDKEGIAITNNNLGFMYQNLSDNAKALEYFKKSLEAYEGINDKAGIANTINNIGLLYFNQSEFDKALEYYGKSLKIQEEINDKEGMSISLNNIAVIYDNRGEIKKALECYEKSLKLCEETKNKESLANTLSNVGDIYNKLGDVMKALEYHHKSFKIKEEMKDKRGIAQSLNFIGLIYFYQEDITKAREYFEKSLKIREEIQDKAGLSVSLNNMGLLCKREKNIPKALDWFNKSLKLKEEIGDKFGMAYALSNIGAIYDDEGDRKTAIEYYKKGLQIREDIKDKEGIAHSACNMANALFLIGELSEATGYANQSMRLSKELGFPSRINSAAIILKKIYAKQEKYKEAFEMYELEIQMRDSINNEETRKATVRKQFQYLYEKQSAADSTKHAELQKIKRAEIEAKGAQIRQEKTQRYALYGGLVLIVVFAGFVGNRLNVARKQKMIIEEQKQQVDKAFAELHEKNKEVIDSINYAKRIQLSLMPTEKYFAKKLNKG